MAGKGEAPGFGKEGDPSDFDVATEGIVIAGPAEGVRSFAKVDDHGPVEEPTTLVLPGTEPPGLSREEAEAATEEVIAKGQELAAANAKDEPDEHSHAADPGAEDSHVAIDVDDGEVNTGDGDLRPPQPEPDDYYEDEYSPDPPDPLERGGEVMEALDIEPSHLSADADVFFDG
ncbi:MAG: hypothetical protein AAFZ07_12500 [Actinomycetota bacterium]